MSNTIKVALISGVVSVVTALIAAAAAIYPSLRQATNAASTAEAAAESAERSAGAAVAANPGALAAHYRGSRPVMNGTTSRFEFSERVYDPDGAVRTGADWRLTIPVSGVYYVGISFRLPYGPDGNSYTTPYVSCSLSVIRRNTTAPETVNESIAFTPACSLSGVYFFEQGDQLFSSLGQAGAYSGNATGDFYSVLVGNGKK
jgi:hypothetical protein